MKSIREVTKTERPLFQTEKFFIDNGFDLLLYFWPMASTGETSKQESTRNRSMAAAEIARRSWEMEISLTSTLPVIGLVSLTAFAFRLFFCGGFFSLLALIFEFLASCFLLDWYNIGAVEIPWPSAGLVFLPHYNIKPPCVVKRQAGGKKRMRNDLRSADPKRV